MTNPHTWPPPELKSDANAVTKWVAIAAWSLCDEAAGLVRKEAEACYTTAYNEARRDGLPKDAARAWASTFLGDPYAANKEYRQTFLTDYEAVSAPHATGLYFALIVYLVTAILLIVAYAVWSNWSVPRTDHWILAGVVVAAVCGWGVCICYAHRFAQKVKRNYLATNPEYSGTFGSWLDVATWNLCDDAKERVCREVRAHYTAAYEAVLKEASSADSAAAHALAALGDPTKAQNQFQTLYLTKSELALVIGRMKPTSGRMQWFLVITFALMSGLYFAGLLRFGFENAPREILFLSNIVLQASMVVFFTLNRRLPRFALAAQLVGMAVAVVPMSIALFSMGFDALLGTTGVIWQAIVAGILSSAPLPFLASHHYLRLIKKLGYEHNRQSAGL